MPQTFAGHLERWSPYLPGWSCFGTADTQPEHVHPELVNTVPFSSSPPSEEWVLPSLLSRVRCLLEISTAGAHTWPLPSLRRSHPSSRRAPRRPKLQVQHWLRSFLAFLSCRTTPLAQKWRHGSCLRRIFFFFTIYPQSLAPAPRAFGPPRGDHHQPAFFAIDG